MIHFLMQGLITMWILIFVSSLMGQTQTLGPYGHYLTQSECAQVGQSMAMSMPKGYQWICTRG
jgi:hypothetical protein